MSNQEARWCARSGLSVRWENTKDWPTRLYVKDKKTGEMLVDGLAFFNMTEARSYAREHGYEVRFHKLTNGGTELEGNMPSDNDQPTTMRDLEDLV